MRLDKFLKVSRIIKRRTIAKDMCDNARIQVNGRVAKAGHDIEAGDTLIIEFGRRILTVEVLDTPNTIRADQAETLYTILTNEEKKEEEWI
ncbi:RNA-binding S4 domain-containing protein [Clostridia bacterium]|nr:RNA-binding S4 domain-containing protein [Clostridia bacterium]